LNGLLAPQSVETAFSTLEAIDVVDDRANGQDAQEPREPRHAILEAAVAEFDRWGYNEASTNRIVRRAGVSKGLLFHYFGSKRGLYMDTLKHCIDHFIEGFIQKTQELSSDVLERVVQFSLVKLELVRGAPREYGVILSFVDAPAGLKDELKQAYREYESLARDTFLEGIDTSRFRDDIELNRALEFLGLTLRAIEQKYVTAFRRGKWSRQEWMDSLPRVHAELQEYVDLLRHGLYGTRRPS